MNACAAQTAYSVSAIARPGNLPCAISGSERVLPPSVAGAFPGHEVKLHIGAAVRPEAYADADSFAEACWDEVRRHLARLDSTPAAEPERLQPEPV